MNILFFIVIMMCYITSVKLEILSGVEENTLEIPELPAPDSTHDIPQLKYGEKVSLDELGPIIVNVDGSLRRITNWDTLTEMEKQSSYRQIMARNKRRLDALKKKDEYGGEATDNIDEEHL